MANKNRKNLITDDRAEDVTMYGEFVPSKFKWITIDNQRENASHLEEISEEISTNKKERNKKKE